MSGVARFVFYSGSSAAAAPGEGKGERRGEGDFADLRAVAGWRAVLSNFHVGAPLEVDGRVYASAEHAFHAAKFKAAGRAEEAARFAADGDVGRAPGVCKLTTDERARWEAAREDAQRAIWRAKFVPDGTPRAALIATRDAELWHYAGRGRRERWHGLEELREMIKPDAEDAPPERR